MKRTSIMTILSKSSVFLCLVFLNMWTAPAYSIAYCALRDPVVNIYKLFPEATSYRSIVHKITSGTQQQVKNKVSFSIHNNELGQHTLYIAMNKKTPIGIVHSRSEVGLWGLIEIVWALDFNLNIVDFTFQRCRERACKELELSLVFRELIKGKSAQELSALIEQENFSFPPDMADNEEIKVLAKLIIRSAIKTALVTEISWHDQLQSIKGAGD